jgi:CheY-like chemotaxis protein
LDFINIDKKKTYDKKGDNMKMAPKVLIVDDNITSRHLIGFYLKNMGCEIFEVDDGQKSLCEIENNKYDLVILDWNMPLMNGYQTLIKGDQILKASSQKQKLPVVIYTNSSLLELKIPASHFFQVRATLSKHLTPFQQMKRIRQMLDAILAF